MSSKEKRGKKTKILLVIKIIIIILLIHIFLNLAKCSFTEEDIITVENERLIEETVDEPVEICDIYEYFWRYSWEGWSEEVNGKITPTFLLTNLENREGVFEIKFAFFDEAKYSFKDFEDKEYEDVKDELPWEAADMYYDTVRKTLKAQKSILIAPSVEKKDPKASYWVYADVTAPTYRDCNFDSIVTVKRNKSITVNEGVKQNVTKKVSLWYLMTSDLVE